MMVEQNDNGEDIISSDIATSYMYGGFRDTSGIRKGLCERTEYKEHDKNTIVCFGFFPNSCDEFYNPSRKTYTERKNTANGVARKFVSKEMKIKLAEQRRNGVQKPPVQNEPTPINQTNAYKLICPNKKIIARVGVRTYLKPFRYWPVIATKRFNEEFEWLQTIKNANDQDFFLSNINSNNQVILNEDKISLILHGFATIAKTYYYLLENSARFSPNLFQKARIDIDYANHKVTNGIENREYHINNNPINWWEGGTKNLYKEETKCISNQWNEFVQTVSKNTWDINVVKEMYASDGNFIKENRKLDRLQALHCPNKQIFWKLANVKACPNKYRNVLNDQAINDQHSREEYILIRFISCSITEFVEDIHCSYSNRIGFIVKIIIC